MTSTSRVVSVLLLTLALGCGGSSGATDAGRPDASLLDSGAGPGSDGGASDAGCGPTADDPCGVACIHLVIPDVPNCGGATLPGGTKPASQYLPSSMWKGGTATNSTGTVTFDATTCVFTFAHTTCGKTWTLDFKQDQCSGDWYGSDSDNPCLFTCPWTCTFQR